MSRHNSMSYCLCVKWVTHAQSLSNLERNDPIGHRLNLKRWLRSRDCFYFVYSQLRCQIRKDIKSKVHEAEGSLPQSTSCFLKKDVSEIWWSWQPTGLAALIRFVWATIKNQRGKLNHSSFMAVNGQRALEVHSFLAWFWHLFFYHIYFLSPLQTHSFPPV